MSAFRNIHGSAVHCFSVSVLRMPPARLPYETQKGVPSGIMAGEVGIGVSGGISAGNAGRTHSRILWRLEKVLWIPGQESYGQYLSSDFVLAEFARSADEYCRLLHNSRRWIP